MLKLVVLCGLLVAVVAKPDVLISSPWEGYSTYISPASTTITKQTSSLIHPSPIVYNNPYLYSHFIKKRSPQFPLGYFGPTTYVASSPIVASPYNPVIQTASVLPAGSLPYTTAHFIKKRSAAQLPASYIVPTTYAAATAPWYSGAYASAPIFRSPLLAHPIAYPHFIKKRSAQHLTYSVPGSFSHQSRFDIERIPTTYSAFSSPVVYNNLYGSIY